MAGRGVHAAGAGIEHHVVGQHHRRGPVVEGVRGGQAFQLGARHGGHDFVAFPAEGLGAAFHQRGGQHIVRAVVADHGVVMVGVHGHRHVVGQGPRGGGPDDDAGVGRVRRGQAQHFCRLGITQGKAHEDGGRGVVVVFHLGLGQGGLARAAPVDGLLAAHHVARFHEIAEFARGGGFVGRVHGHVRLVPGAQHAKALEFLALDVQVLFRVLAAALAHHVGGQFLLLFAQFLFNLVFDGQAVTVPAGHVAGGVALHVARLDHHVLQDLVQRRPEVNVPVGVRGAVVQDVRPLLAGCLRHGGVGVDAFPELEHFRLALGEVGLHGKFGVGQMQGLLVVAHGRAAPRGCRHAGRSGGGAWPRPAG